MARCIRSGELRGEGAGGTNGSTRVSAVRGAADGGVSASRAETRAQTVSYGNPIGSGPTGAARIFEERPCPPSLPRAHSLTLSIDTPAMWVSRCSCLSFSAHSAKRISPGKIIVSGDAAATAANIIAHPTLFRMTFATYLVEGFCDIILCVLWYIILKPVNRNLALISAFVGVVSMITFAIAQSHFWARRSF